MKANEASHIVIGAALRIHSALGAGVLESAYDACLFHELSQAGLQFEHQVALPIVYKGVQLKTGYRISLFHTLDFDYQAVFDKFVSVVSFVLKSGNRTGGD